MDEREELKAFSCRKALSFRSWRIATRMQLLRLVDEVHRLLSWLIATRMQLLRLVDEVHLLVSWPISTRMLPLRR